MRNKKDLSDLLHELRNSFEYRLETLTQTFSDELWLAMAARDLNEAQLARNAGVGRQFLTRIFRGKSNVTLKTMAKLVEAVGYRLYLHLAPAEMNCKWVHVVKNESRALVVPQIGAVVKGESHESVLGSTIDFSRAVTVPQVSTPAVTKVANEELALAA